MDNSKKSRRSGSHRPSGYGNSAAKRGKRRGPAARSGGANASPGAMGTDNEAYIIARSKPLFPYRTKRNIQYYASGSVSTGTATANSYVFSANGAYDPDISGTGGQPMGFDQMMLYYNHYVVKKARIRAVIGNTSTSLTPSVGIHVSGSSSVVSSIEQLVESGDLVFHELSFAGSYGSRARLNRTLNVGKFQGVNNVLDDPNMRGDSASNPAEQSYFHLVTWNPYSATQVASSFQVLIDYEVWFTEPRTPSVSLRSRHPAFDSKRRVEILRPGVFAEDKDPDDLFGGVTGDDEPLIIRCADLTLEEKKANTCTSS